MLARFVLIVMTVRHFDVRVCTRWRTQLGGARAVGATAAAAARRAFAHALRRLDARSALCLQPGDKSSETIFSTAFYTGVYQTESQSKVRDLGSDATK